MARILLSGRVPAALAASLERHAAAAGVPRYQAINRALELGIAQLAGSRARDESAPALEALGQLLARVERVERLAERALFAAGAAYVVGLRSGLYGKTVDQQERFKSEVSGDADRIFERQLSIALSENDQG